MAGKLVSRWIDGFNDRTFPVEEIYTLDCTLLSGTSTMRGHQEVSAYFQGYAVAFPDCRFELVSAVESPERVAIEARLVGTHTGPLHGSSGEIPATGKRLDLPFCVVMDLEGGKVKRHRGYYDQFTFMSQLGLLPSPAGA